MPKHSPSKPAKKKTTKASISTKEKTTKATTATADPMLFGDQQVESAADNNAAGLAEAFPFAGQISGTANAIDVYLDSHNKATTVLAAIYANDNGQPGALIASGKLSSPRAGAWNQLPITATTVSGSKSYWIAVLGKGGTLYFRDRASGPCESVNSRQTSLSSLPSTWTNGAQWSTCPISAFVAGTASAVSTASNPPTTTTPSTDPTTTTTTTSPPPLPIPPVPLTSPQISGTAMEGQTLTTDNGTWTNSPTSYGYQWQDCDTSGANCSNISGATGASYALSANDVGHTIRVIVSAGNSGGTTLTPATSSQTGVVQPMPTPGNTALPTISGTTTQGQTLTAADGSWSGSPTSYTYQWRDCDTSGANCTNISGATASSYALTSNEVGDTLRVVVKATNAGGTTPATSAQTAVVAASTPAPPTNTAAPALSGTATQGQTLSTSNGSWTGSPTGYTYQWRDCDTSGNNCANISGATGSSYTVAAGDVGDTIRAAVTAANAGGSATATSAQTSTVVASGGGGGGTQTTNCFASPMACGYPDPAAPTGNAAHVGPSPSCSSMTQVNGDVTSSSSGQTIQNETIHGMLYINTANVTVNNVCVITPDAESGPAIYIESGANNTLVENTSAGAVDRNAKNMEAAVYNWSGNAATLDHDYFYNCGECIHDGIVTLTNSYVIANGMDNTGDHREDIYLSESTTLNHDTLFLPPENTPQVAVVFAANAPNPPSGTKLSLTNSLLAGGDNILEAGPPQVSGGDTIKNNNIARCTTGPMSSTSDGGTACDGYHGSSSSSDSYTFDSHGYWPNGGVSGVGCAGASGVNTWTGNIWDDNGSAMGC